MDSAILITIVAKNGINSYINLLQLLTILHRIIQQNIANDKSQKPRKLF